MKIKDIQTAQDEILLAALPVIADEGWSLGVLMEATEKSGYETADLRDMFPKGAIDAWKHFSGWADRQMVEALDEVELSNMRIRDKIAHAVKTRLDILEPYKGAVKQSLKLVSLPPANIRAAKAVWATADQIWWMAGDTATDYNHYSKRSLLSGILGSTTLFWLKDQSDNHEKTWEFLDHRIENALTIGQFVGKFKKQ